MRCQTCGNELRQNSIYCHECGTPRAVSRGNSLLRFAFILMVVIPVFQSVCSFSVTAVVIPDMLPWEILKIVVVVTLFVLFMLAFRGKQWAGISAGILIIAFGLLYVILAILSFPNNDFFLSWFIFGFLYIVLGFCIIMLGDVRAFLKYKQTKTG